MTTMRPPKVPRPTPIPRVTSPLISRLDEVDLPGFWSGIATTTPLVEATADSARVIVTFCWRDEQALLGDPAEQVLLFANRLTDETSLIDPDAADTMLTRLGDLWHASFEMETDWRASYCFLVQRSGEPAPWQVDGHVGLRAALDAGQLDPRNPQTCRNSIGVPMSVVSLPDAPEQPWLTRQATTRGSVTEHLDHDGPTLWIYRHPDAGFGAPLMAVLDGEVWLRDQDLPTTLDNLVAAEVVPPLTAVFVAAGGRERRWIELGSRHGGEYVATDLLERAEALGAMLGGPVVVVGQSLGGLTALRAGLRHPDRIDGVISASASLWADDLVPDLDAWSETGSAGPRIHLSHGRQEWVLDPPHRELAARMAAAGVPVSAVAYNGGHDYAWWRGAIADGLIWFFAE